MGNFYCIVQPKTYAAAANQQRVMPIDISNSFDEGIGINTTHGVQGDTSQTYVKTTYQQSEPETQIPAPNPIPVRLTHRDENRNERQTNGKAIPNGSAPHKNIDRSQNKTLIIGDSILNPINPKGMVQTLRKHSKSGAKVGDILGEIKMYDLMSFESVIVYIGGNDASGSTDIELFQEYYDQLLSIIKTGNSECRVYMCYISPRGDTDVTEYNACIESLSTHWKNHGVSIIKETEEFFYGKDDLPTFRYYSSDGIHLSSSGVRRLLHAINNKVHIVRDFEMSVYIPRLTGPRGNGGRRLEMQPAPGQGQRHSKPHAGRNRAQPMNQHRNRWNIANNRRRTVGCYECGMVGHKFKDCWNKR